MNNHDLSEIADIFYRLWIDKSLADSDQRDMSLLSLPQAYDVQQQVIDRCLSEGEQIAGYKVGCTSSAIREQFGLAEPICGRLMLPHIFRDDVTLQSSDYAHCAIEPEFVICLAVDIANEVVNEAELIDSIAWIAPGIELHRFKFWMGQPTSQELIASNGIHAGLIVGEPRNSPTDIDLMMEGVGVFRGQQLVASGIGAEIMGGPLTSLKWLTNHLLERGQHLKAGQLVIPGSPVELISVTANDEIRASFTRVGSVTSRFTDADR